MMIFETPDSFVDFVSDSTMVPRIGEQVECLTKPSDRSSRQVMYPLTVTKVVYDYTVGKVTVELAYGE